MQYNPRETKLDLYVDRNSTLAVNINFEGKEYSIRLNRKGLKISCNKGMAYTHQGECLLIE